MWSFLLKTNRQKVAQPSSSFPKRPIKFTYKQAKRTVWNYFSGKVCVLAEKFPNSLSLSLWVKVEKHFFWNCNIRFCSGCAIAIGFSFFAKKILDLKFFSFTFESHFRLYSISILRKIYSAKNPISHLSHWNFFIPWLAYLSWKSYKIWRCIYWKVHWLFCKPQYYWQRRKESTWYVHH